MSSNYSSYPRPMADSGISFHCGANGSYPLGRPEHWALWIERIKAMGGTWAKALILSDCKPDPNEQPMIAVKRMVDAGLEVVVRLYREKPYPGILTPRQLAQISVLVKIGISYFESGNEPNLNVEWQNHQIGSPESVADDWLVDARALEDVGGYPGIPACAPGGNVDDIDFMRGFFQRIATKKASFDRVWIATHNYVLNHPLDYPDDPINRGEKPNGTIMDAGESNGFRKFEALNNLSQQYLGLTLPVIATEGGPVMDLGFSNDPRYPQLLNESQHAISAKEIAYRMMWNLVPPYYLASCFWILAGREMESPVSTGFEGHSWFPFWLGDGVQAVRALKVMPKQVRPIIPIDQPPGTVSKEDAIRAEIEKVLKWDTFPWLKKEAMRRGLIHTDITTEIPITYNEKKYLVQVYGNTVLGCTGSYTESETFQFPFFKEG